MQIERRESYRDRFHFTEYTFCPLSRAQNHKHSLDAIKDSHDNDGLRRIVIFDDLQVNMFEFNDLMTYFLYHAKELNTLTISTILAKYEWDKLKGLCQEMAVFKLNNRRIIDRIVEGTAIEKNCLYTIYDSFVASGLYEHIPLDLRPKLCDVRINQ